MKKILVALGAIAASLVVALPGAFGSGRAETPGVTARLVTIGGTFPLSGPASSYAPIPVGMAAYFSYVNASKTNGKRGVLGRQILFKFYDDGYVPANTVQRTRQLVEQDKVFALVGGLGTAQQESVAQYTNQMKVPQIYVSTGATEWGAKQSSQPWTIGWQPDYQAESAVYGRYIAKNLATAKIAVLYQNDDFGKDYIAGLEVGLTKAHKSQIVITQSYESTDASVTNQVLAMRRSGADTVLIAALPTQTIVTYATMAKIGWKPTNIFTTSVAATSTFLPIAVRNAGAAEVDGTITSYYTKDPANARWDSDAGMKLYMQIMHDYGPAGSDPKNGLYLYGMAKAYTFVQALKGAGPNPTREGLMKAVLNMNDKTNPFLLPGVVTKTGKNDPFPVSQQQLQTWTNGAFNPFGDLIDTRPKGL